MIPMASASAPAQPAEAHRLRGVGAGGAAVRGSSGQAWRG